MNDESCIVHQHHMIPPVSKTMTATTMTTTVATTTIGSGQIVSRVMPFGKTADALVHDKPRGLDTVFLLHRSTTTTANESAPSKSSFVLPPLAPLLSVTTTQDGVDFMIGDDDLNDDHDVHKRTSLLDINQPVDSATSEWTSLDVQIDVPTNDDDGRMVPQSFQQDESSPQTLSFRFALHRSSQELAVKALQRLQITLERQFTRVANVAAAAKNKQQQSQQQQQQQPIHKHAPKKPKHWTANDDPVAATPPAMVFRRKPRQQRQTNSCVDTADSATFVYQENVDHDNGNNNDDDEMVIVDIRKITNAELFGVPSPLPQTNEDMDAEEEEGELWIGIPHPLLSLSSKSPNNPRNNDSLVPTATSMGLFYNNNNYNRMLYVRLDRCPPTIAAIQTFEDCKACLFVDIPIVLDVQTLYSTHIQIDWYVNSNLVQSALNECCFVPKQHHIGQHVVVVLRPLRRRQQPRINYISTQNDTPWIVGDMEPYRFEHAIQELPNHTILKLRQNWLRLQQRQHERQKQQEQQQQQPHDHGTMIRIMTYNILADQNAFPRANSPHIFFYPYLPQEYLLRIRRMPIVLHEILSHRADIVALQEVDQGVYDALFRPVMAYYGYQSYFTCKAHAGNREGCALFWSLQTFCHVPAKDQKSFALRDLIANTTSCTTDVMANSDNDSWWSSNQSIARLLQQRPDLRHVMQTHLGHVIQAVPLMIRQQRQHGAAAATTTTTSNGDRDCCCWVVNTHLFFHPRASHIRTLQMYFLARQLALEMRQQSAITTESSSSTVKAATIICGDFNCGLQDAAGQLLSRRTIGINFGSLQADLHDYAWNDHEADEAHHQQQQQQDLSASAAAVSDDIMTHDSADSATGTVDDHTNDTTDDAAAAADHKTVMDFPALSLGNDFPILASAFCPPPVVTHCISAFHGTLDHILYSTQHFAVASTAPMPTMAQVTQDIAMPSPTLPSDHVSLVCDLQWIGTCSGLLRHHHKDDDNIV